jgi:hypothetical protein
MNDDGIGRMPTIACGASGGMRAQREPAPVPIAMMDAMVRFSWSGASLVKRSRQKVFSIRSTSL